MLREVSLYTASKEQTITSWRRTAVEWGKGLTLEEYVDRELLGEKEEFARDGKQITWVLAPRKDPTTLDFFCSCETFKRKIVIAHSMRCGRQDTEQPILKQGYAIGSVFTPPQHRGKGYAKHMMRLLHWVLANEEYLSTQIFPEQQWGTRPPRVPNAGDASVAALWSDIGPTFYEGCGMGVSTDKGDGWIVMNPFSTVWDVHDVDLSGNVEGGEVTWLDEQSAKAVWDKDATEIKAELVQEAKRKEGIVQFSFLPNEGVAEFQWFRLHYHFNRYVLDPPQFRGLVIRDGGDFATWTCDFRVKSRKTLILTRLRASEDRVEELMLRVLRYARGHGLDEVESWNLAPNLERALGRLKGTRVERSEHYPAIKWYGEEEVEWNVNERFCWS